jgi:hypothetical protein
MSDAKRAIEIRRLVSEINRYRFVGESGLSVAVIVGAVQRAVKGLMNAFKEAGAEVCSTHYPQSTNMRIFTGTVPTRVGYRPLVPLYEADALGEKPSDVNSFVWSSSLLRNYK